MRITLAVGAILCAAFLPAQAQHAAKVYPIGVLETVEAASNGENLGAFRQGLRELGSVEGPHFVIEYRSADGRADRLPDLARELVRLNVDVIVTRGNVTGFHVMAPLELSGKRLQLLKEAVPAASRVGILWNPVGIHAPLTVRETEKVARAIGVQLKSFEVPRSEAFEDAFEAALVGQVDALIAVEDSLTFADRARIVEFAAMSRLPAIYGLREFVDAGGLMSYGADHIVQ